jgi:hypothetical protein
MIIDVELEEWSGSPVTRGRTKTYERKAATSFADEAARLTPRQGVFYRNLIRLAVALESSEIPVDFELPDGSPVFLDRGCIKIAEHAHFIDSIIDGPSGVVDNIRLAFDVGS